MTRTDPSPVIAFCSAAACAASVASATTPTFTDVSAQANVAVVSRAPNFNPGDYPPGTVLPSTELRMMAAGGAIGDFNHDGYQDIFLLGLGEFPDRLFINNGDGTFSEQGEAWGIDEYHMGCGATVGDYNDDGLLDIFVTSHGEPDFPFDDLNRNHKLWRNNGDGTFTDVAEAAGVIQNNPQSAGGWGAAFGDYDLDGDLDLAVPDWNGNGLGNKLFENNGDGTFTDVTPTAVPWFNFGEPGGGTRVHGFSARFADMDGDFYPELLWASDFGSSQYFINNTDGTFTWFTPQSGTAKDTNGMGSTVADYDRDGDLDWYVTSIMHSGVNSTEGNKYYRNNGNHIFTESSAANGTRDGGWGWGASSVDIDHDGWFDIIATNGWVGNQSNESWATDTTRIFLNDSGASSFAESAAICSLIDPSQGRGLATFDMDNDGDRDILVIPNNNRDSSNTNQTLKLFRNDLLVPDALPGQNPSDANWVRIFMNTRGHDHLAPHGVNAKVYVKAGGATRYHEVMLGSNFLVNDEVSAHFGLGEATVIDEIRIDWPDGRSTRARNVAANQTLEYGPDWRFDVNADGIVDVRDVTFVIFRLGDADECQRADTNRNGIVEVVDIVDVIQNLWKWGHDAPCPGTGG